jgi:hypothetical protein
MLLKTWLEPGFVSLLGENSLKRRNSDVNLKIRIGGGRDFSVSDN